MDDGIDVDDDGGDHDSPSNDRVLTTFDPPLAVEHLIYEVQRHAYESWRATEFEMWTKAEADRFPFFVSKENWIHEADDVITVSIVITWTSAEAWHSIDPDWLDRQEAAFAEIVGADNYRLVYAAHDAGRHWHKVSEYRRP